MKRIVIIILLVVNVFTGQLSAEVFKWDIKKNDRLELVKTAKIVFIMNNKLARKYEERNIIDLTCYKNTGTQNFLKGSFSIYTKDIDAPVFKLTEKNYSDFIIESSGKNIIPEKTYMPNLRNIPTFPKKDLVKGDVWEFPGEIIINNFSVPFALEMAVEYQLLNFEEKNGRKIAEISYNYVLNKSLTGSGFPSDFPSQIAGKNSGVIYWDMEKNIPAYQKDEYHTVFLFGGPGTGYKAYEWKMDINSNFAVYADVSPEEKEKDKDELSKKMPDNVTIENTDKGLVIRLGEILFEFNSAQLKGDASITVDKVVAAIKEKYPDREIIVEGHTDNTGNRDYNNQLSENRAKSVAEKIKPVISHDKLSYKGYGKDKPLNSNKTEEERKKNRRVDIIIKLN